MPAQYNGQPSLILPLTPVLISSSTNANPIVVQTSAAHNLSNGDYVDIQNHQTNTAANGINAVTVVDGTHFSIPVAGVGVGGATGTAQPLSVGATMQIPVDGDSRSAASVVVPMSVLADRTAFLAKGLGAWAIAQKSIAYYSNPLAAQGTSWAHLAAAPVTAATATQMISDGVGWAQLAGSNFAVLPTTPSVAPVFAITGVVLGDIVEIRLDTTLNLLAAGAGRLALYGSLGVPGAVPTWPGSYNAIVPASAYCPSAGIAPVSIGGISTIGLPGSNTLWIQPVFVPQTSSSQSPVFGGDTQLVVTILRPTGMPQ